MRALLALTVIGLATAALGADADAERAKVLDKLAKQRVESARRTYEVLWRNYRERRASEDGLYRWSLRWLDAERQLSKQPADQAAAFKSHLDRMKDLERLIANLQRAGQATIDEVSAAEYYRIEAEIWLLESRAEKNAG